MWILKISLILVFGLIFYQDLKERMAWWFLFPIVSVLAIALHLQSDSIEFVTISIVFNLFFIGFLLLVIYLYSKYKMKTSFFEVIGLGDVLLFVALSFSFSTITFIILFVFSLLIALLLHIVLPNKEHQNVPLAGYMSLFFAISYLAFWFHITPNLYRL